MIYSFNINDFEQLLINLSVKLNFESYDTYSLSPVYFKFTGRNGLWYIRKDERLLVISEHPNIKGKTLIFPEISPYDDYSLTIEYLKSSGCNPSNVQLSRFTPEQIQNLMHRVSKNNEIKLNIVSEHILDWNYPSRIIDTSDLATRLGKPYAQLRQRLRKLNRNNIKVEKINIVKHRDTLSEFVKGWAINSDKENYSLHDLCSPYERLFELADELNGRISGLVFFLGTELVGFNMWDIAIHNKEIANQFAICSKSIIKGLSEWQTIIMSEFLQNQGVRYINLGGSETHDLDRFKRKFSPFLSQEMHTIEVQSIRELTEKAIVCE